jgi:hypothetical protein
MTRRRVIFGAVALAFVGAMVLGIAGQGNPLDHTLWGAGVADSPYCHQTFYFWRPNC